MERLRKTKIVGKTRLTIGLALVGILLLIRIFSSAYMDLAVSRNVQDLITFATSVIIESLPFVLLGILLSIVVQVWLPNGFIVKHLPSWPPLRRVCISFLGVFLPVCECGNVPLARGLLTQGFTVSESLVFLLATPILNPVTIITTYQAFGGDIVVLIARILGGFLIANTIGWIYSKHKNPENMLTSEFATSCKTIDKHNHHVSRVDKSLGIFVGEVSNILPALFVGALLAATIQVAIPREVLLGLGSNPALSILAMMLLAFIVSICSNVDAFFALTFSGTFTAGSLVSFLVFGPIIDVKMLTLMKTTYKLRILLQITLIVALMSAVIGLVVNYAF